MAGRSRFVQLRRQKDSREQTQGGYDCEFVERPSKIDADCSICLMVLRSPYLASCCGQNFCEDCIKCVKRAGKRCPLCQQRGFFITYNRAYDNALNQYVVYCTHRKKGCDWQGKLETLDKHLNIDADRGKQCEGCAFVNVACRHIGCGQSFLRRDIVKHQSRECLQRPYTCQHCRKYKSVYKDVINHISNCPSYPVDCPNKCMQAKVERQHVNQHLQKCPLQVVECEFKYAGCDTTLPRKDMSRHLEDAVGHIALLARQNQDLIEKIRLREEMIQRTTEVVAQYAEVLPGVLQHCNQQMNRKVDELTTTVLELRRRFYIAIIVITIVLLIILCACIMSVV